MPAPDDPTGAKSPENEGVSANEPSAASEKPYDSYYPYDNEDPYSSGGEMAPSALKSEEKPPETPPVPETQAGSGGGGEPPKKEAEPAKDPEDDEEDGMLRMSFLEHLEELRARIIRALAGVGVAFVVSLTFANQLWLIVSEPAVAALKQLGLADPRLTQIAPMEVFNTVWVKLPILTSVFLASPWVLYQVWAFIAPGLYKKERRWAGPFVMSSAGLFILGGLFAYFVAFRFGLVFLLGIGRDIKIQPMVSVTEYFDLFVNVTLGVGLVFELPVLIFFLTLLRIVTPGFLLRNSRYAILIIVIIAAIVTPTPDVFNLMLFAVPMCLLFFVGIFAGYLLVLSREGKRFPWRYVLYVILAVLAVVAGAAYLAVTKYG
ncbi:MAG: twin-arginine translocase subunit TatC, partial [Acidobacteriales bacterium]|nr:twin-arginine translocase subunit TatC [Terriglobales bacterium]